MRSSDEDVVLERILDSLTTRDRLTDLDGVADLDGDASGRTRDGLALTVLDHEDHDVLVGENSSRRLGSNSLNHLTKGVVLGSDVVLALQVNHEVDRLSLRSVIRRSSTAPATTATTTSHDGTRDNEHASGLNHSQRSLLEDVTTTEAAVPLVLLSHRVSFSNTKGLVHCERGPGD